MQQNTSGSVGGIYIQDGASNTGNSLFIGDNNGVARVVVDGDGNVGIGTSSPNSKLEVYDATSAVARVTAGTEIFEIRNTGSEVRLAVVSADPLTFRTSNVEAMRIDSSGNLLVGTTSITAPTTGFTAGFSGSYAYTQIAHPTGTGSGATYSNFLYNSASIGSITQSGTTAVLYNTTSDQRLKENIQDADSASSLIDSLQVRKFDWKSDNSHQRYGFVAQELVTVAPEAVHQPADEEEMMAVDYSKLVPMLVKEIQSLRKRLAALEAK